MSSDVPTIAGRVDAARAVVLPGPGVVVRLPGLLCLLRLDPDDPVDCQGHLARLVEICTEISATAPTAPGRPLARRLARWLGALDPGPDVGVVSATETGLALFLHGGVDAVLGGQRYSAAESGAWLDRLLPHPGGPLVLLPTDQSAPEGPARAVFDLRGGVVPAGAVQLVARSGALPASMARPASMPAPAPTPAPDPLATPAEAADVPPDPTPAGRAAPLLASAILGVAPDEAPRAPLAGGARAAPLVASAILGVAPEEPPRPPLADGAARSRPSPRRREPEAAEPAEGPTDLIVASDGQPTLVEPAANGAPIAYGHLCARDHLNDPRSHSCVVCGIRMDEHAGVIQAGVRPPLGLLVFDDGSTYTLDADYLLGRTPESDPRVQRGQLRALPVDDPESQLSRGHLVIKLDGWDVTAIDESRNGTLVARSAEESWSRLTPGRPLRLLPGTRVRVGGRMFAFRSPGGVR